MRPAAVLASAGTSPPLPRTRIAGPIFAFTPASQTTESLAGRTTTHPLRSLGGCTFLGTTSVAARLSSSATPLTTVRPGPTSDSWLAAVPSSATCRSPATWPRATCMSRAWTKEVGASLTMTSTTFTGPPTAAHLHRPQLPRTGRYHMSQRLLRLHVSRHGWLLATRGLG